MILRPRTLVATTVLVLLAGCTLPQRRDALQVELETPSRPLTATKAVTHNDEQPITIKHDEKKAASEAKIEGGSGNFINADAARAPLHQPPGGDGQITLNFESMPIQAAVQQILGGLLQENYTIAPSVTGTVTFSTARPITTEQAMPILEMLLGWTNNTLIRKEGRYEVVPIKDAIAGNLTPRVTPPRMAQGYEVRAFPLRYISATEMQKLLKPYAKADAVVSADNARSMIVMAGTASELENYQRTIEVFDVDWLKGMSVGVYALRNMDIGKIMPELDKIFGAAGESPLAGMFRFIPMETTNSVVVITPQRSYLEQAQQWLYRLDMGAGENGTQLYVYDVKNAKAIELADHLNAIFTGRTGGSGAYGGGNVAPGLRPVTIGGLGGSAGALGGVGSTGGMNQSRLNQSSYNSQTGQRTGTSGTTATGGVAGAIGAGGTSTTGAGNAPGAAGKTEIDIRITPIEENNQLLIMATPGEWDSILAAIKRLDIPQLQVQLEVKILEVTLSGDLQFGVQWWLAGLINNNNGGSNSSTGYQYGPEFQGNQADRHRASLGALAGAAPTANGGFFYSFLNNNFQVAINALQTKGQARTLSAPSMVVMNNQEAQINVGTQIPVVQTYYNGYSGVVPTNGSNGALGTSAYGGTTGSVQYLNTGVILDVKPRVNPGGLVYLEVQQEVSNPEAAPAGTNPPIDQRQLSTQVAVQSGRTVLLGGLIRDLGTVNDTGLPGLNSIPILGRLFGSTTQTTTRTELIVLITPQVINNAEDADRVTEEYQNRFKSLAPLRAQNAAEPAPEPMPPPPPPPQPQPATPPAPPPNPPHSNQER